MVDLGDEDAEQPQLGAGVAESVLDQLGELDGTTDVEVGGRAGAMTQSAASMAIELSGPRPGGVSISTTS